MSRILTLVVCVLALAGGDARAQLLSPGPLSRAHAALDGDDRCASCHQSGKQVVARLCLGCHKDLAAQIAAGRGLHGRPYLGAPCEQCHVEHVGANAKLVRWPGGGMDKLDHRLTGYVLTGGHTRPACLDCHTKRSPLGAPVFVGTPTTCAGCHPDPHRGRFGAACAGCHGVADWKAFDRAAFDHTLTAYPLTGQHVATPCEACHPGTPPTWKPRPFATCDACHPDPHAGGFTPRACTSCHDTGGWAVADARMRGAHPGLSLAGGHASVACAACHDRGNDRPPARGRSCKGCHPPIHLASFGARCESCHAQIRWVGLPEATGRANHGKTRYPLVAKHATVACARCHPRARPPARRWKQLAFDACTACHADAHAGEFAARGGGDCASCHTLRGFVPTTFGVRAHATTAFALDGRHVATPCSGCHTGARPRADLRLPRRACADCHANPHGPQFAAELTRGGCASCHTPVDWHQPRIDHTRWPLVGAHARATCASCHGAARGAQPAAYRGVPRTCAGCHDDVHAGQFTQRAPVKACDACHAPTAFAIAPTFDHARQAGFPLDGLHQPLACATCHAPSALRDGTTAVRWRLGYRQCKDCHASPHGETR